jgi:hypothetical protein
MGDDHLMEKYIEPAKLAGLLADEARLKVAAAVVLGAAPLVDRRGFAQTGKRDNSGGTHNNHVLAGESVATIIGLLLPPGNTGFYGGCPNIWRKREG